MTVIAVIEEGTVIRAGLYCMCDKIQADVLGDLWGREGLDCGNVIG